MNSHLIQMLCSHQSHRHELCKQIFSITDITGKKGSPINMDSEKNELH
jgi:hypothetical protein